ncbi:MAG: sodium-independent anion transporter [Deltaproteobacteria bacterium CG11_big_fil_rev_8_21_14_0_20_47_16]|nr:MAG: sodium-independent anion transporter [Deltaproteobacteria bacterium CG11_big_fil_rev_8_21_14_0_20_47_16]
MKNRDAVFFPKILTTLKHYSIQQLGKDLAAGVIVGIVALPLAIAFAIASGVTPDRGLATAIVAGFLISSLGGSRVQIGGPTGAFVVIVYGIVQKFGVDGLIISTLIAGVLLILMGSLRLGAIIKFIPYPLTVGFTAGIAVVIFTSQVKDFFGFPMATLPSEFIDKWEAYFHALPQLDPVTVTLATSAFAILILWPKVTHRIPGSIIAIVLLTVVAYFFQLPVETIGSRFGELSSGFPQPHWPHASLSEIKQLIPSAMTIALLGAIESLLSATVADGMIESHHRSNTELIAQGIANIASPLFGGIPATGAIARTATNVKNGGRTPIAGITHALVLLLIVLLFGKWASLIPLCVLSAILMMVAYHMSEWRSFKSLLRAPRMDVAVLLTTFILTVLLDLTVAVEIGLLMAAALFVKRMTDATTVRSLTKALSDAEQQNHDDHVDPARIPKGVEVYEVEGAFFFGAAETLRNALTIVETPPKVMILRLRHVLALDATGIRAILDICRWCRRAGATLILSGVHAQPLIALEQAGSLDTIGMENVLGTFDEALNRAVNVLRAGSTSEA